MKMYYLKSPWREGGFTKKQVLNKQLAIIVGIIAVLLFWAISVQRGLVQREELCTNAMNQIGVQLSSRWDLITALIDMVKQYSEHEYQTLTDVISMRRDLKPTASAQDIEEQEGLIGKLVGRINMLSETYPDLKADRIYLSTMNDMKQYEENVRHSRMIYNDSVTRFNRAVRQMPNNLVAGMFGFRIREYLEEDAKKRNFPTI